MHTHTVNFHLHLGPDSIYRCHLTSKGNPIVQIRRLKDCLISTMGIPIPVRWHLFIEPAPVEFSLKHYIHNIYIIGSMVSHWRVIVGLSQSASTVGWGSPLHAWLASVNWIGCIRHLNRGYCYGARGMHYHILLRQYSQNYYTYNSVMKNTYSPCHKDACVQISNGNIEWLLRYKGVS